MIAGSSQFPPVLLLLPHLAAYALGMWMMDRLAPGQFNHPAWRYPLGLALGWGMYSLIFYMILAEFPGLGARLPDWLPLAIDGFLAASLLLRRKQPEPGALETSTHSKPPGRGLLWALALALLIALGGTWLLGNRLPYGMIDAVTMWNRHARLLALGETYWRWTGARDLPWWFHDDYPLLLSSLVARGWQLVPGFPPLAAQLVNGLAAFGTVSLLYGALTRLAGQLQAWFGAMALLGSAFFFYTAMTQVADVLVAFYLLAGVTVLFAGSSEDSGKGGKFPRGMLAVAGFLLACSAWTKNDGLLYVMAIPGTLLLANGLKDCFGLAGKTLPWVVAGMLPPLLALARFKAGVVAPSDLLAGTPADFLVRLTDPQRTGLILNHFLVHGLTAGSLLLNPVTLALFAWLLGRNGAPDKTASRITLVFLLLCLLGLALVYQLSPYDTAWHLQTSLPRLLLQLWPIYVFWVSVNVKQHEPGTTSASAD